MKKNVFILSALFAFPFVALAQTAPADYETQSAALKPVKFFTLAELRAAAPNLKGKTIEIKGEIKGIFARNGALTVLFQPIDGNLMVVAAPENARSNSALKPGSMPRILARVESINGDEVNLSLLNASLAAPAEPLFNDANDDPGAPIILAPMTEMILPEPGAAPTTAPRPTVVRTSPQTTTTGVVGVDPSQQSTFTALARRFNPRLSNEMANQISAAIVSASTAQNLDPRFLAAIVSVESSFDPYSLSSSGAMGLGQIMPFNLKGLGITNAWDPMQNLHGSAKMLRQNLNRFAGQKDGTLLAVAAYHAGPNAVSRAGNQVPDKPATQRYVWKVYYAYKALAPELF